MDWYVSLCSMILLQDTDGGLLQYEAFPFILLASCQAGLVMAGLLLAVRGAHYEYELPVGNPSELAVDAAAPRGSVRWKWVVFCCILAGVYLMAARGFVNEETDRNLLFNPLVTFGLGLIRLAKGRCEDPEAQVNLDQKRQEWVAMCQSFNELVRQYRSDRQVCSTKKRYITDYSFIKRKPDSPIRNIFLFFMETTRADMTPFNYSSPVAKKFTPAAAEQKGVTPFMEEFVKKSRYSVNSKSVASYTIKAMISALCSIYPLPRNHISEHKYEFYRMCLPHLLRKYGNFSAGFFQPMIMGFDHQDSIFNNSGFDISFGAEALVREKARFGRPPGYYINCLGYEDGPFRRPMMEWVDNVTREGKPFFLSYSASVSHGDFRTPPYWIPRRFVKDDWTLNRYLNAQSFMDDFIRKVMQDFEDRNLTKNTLFIFLGDHGVSLGEHGLWQTPQIPYETQFNIPIIIYSGNERWLRKFPPRRVNDSWTTLDVIPTVLDALRFDGKMTDFGGDYLYEGQSMIRDGKYELRVQVSLSNPGMSYLVLREKGRKIAFAENGDKKEEVYDLENDPEEEKKIKPEMMSPELQKWVEEMRAVRSLYINKTTEWYMNGTMSLRK